MEKSKTKGIEKYGKAKKKSKKEDNTFYDRKDGSGKHKSDENYDEEEKESASEKRGCFGNLFCLSRKRNKRSTPSNKTSQLQEKPTNEQITVDNSQLNERQIHDSPLIQYEKKSPVKTNAASEVKPVKTSSAVEADVPGHGSAKQGQQKRPTCNEPTYTFSNRNEVKRTEVKEGSTKQKKIETVTSNNLTPATTVKTDQPISPDNNLLYKRTEDKISVDINTDNENYAKVPKGLKNLGNTCFFNSVMQNLNQSFLLEQVLSENEFSHCLPMKKAMVDFYKAMNKGSSSPFTPNEVFKNVCHRTPRFSGGRQQDSHELLRHLLDCLRFEERDINSSGTDKRKILTNVDKVFGGHIMTVYTCEFCRRPYHVCEPMLDISLPIAFGDLDEDKSLISMEEENKVFDYEHAAKFMMMPLNFTETKDNQNQSIVKYSNSGQQQGKKNSKRKGATVSDNNLQKKPRTHGRSVEDCLAVFTKMEFIDNEYLCMKCHADRMSEGETDYKMSSATKRTLIFNPPALLTLHLKRFEQTCNGFVKCNTNVTYSEKLDISPYCSYCCQRNKDNTKNIWYSLYGVVVHSGSLSGGHYVAYVKTRSPNIVLEFLQNEYLDRESLTPDKIVEIMKEVKMRSSPATWEMENVPGEWYCISDSYCERISCGVALQQQAYLLFYERMENQHSTTL